VTRDEVVAWLEGRRPEAPPTLATHLRDLVVDGSGTLPEVLAAHGQASLARVLAQPGAGRGLALDLLASDALVTYAFEAQAEQEWHGLVALARWISGGEG
jgi:hypothetical protein